LPIIICLIQLFQTYTQGTNWQNSELLSALKFFHPLWSTEYLITWNIENTRCLRFLLASTVASTHNWSVC
jgi:hypothetical protein